MYNQLNENLTIEQRLMDLYRDNKRTYGKMPMWMLYI